MHIKLWGTRGSLPRALTHQGFKNALQHWLRVASEQGIKDIAGLQALVADDSSAPLTYGGNTTCTEIRHRGNSYVVDLGTGLVGFAEEQRAAGNRKFTFLPQSPALGSHTRLAVLPADIRKRLRYRHLSRA